MKTVIKCGDDEKGELKMDVISVNGVKYIKEQDNSQISLVRTYSAGVHVGELVYREGKEVKLRNASIIYRWRGANTLREVATEGVVTDDFTRISMPVSEVILTEAIEIMPVSEKAAKTLKPVWNS